MTTRRTLRRRQMLAAAALPLGTLISPHHACRPAAPATSTQRRIMLDLAQAKQPLDRFFDRCVGADCPGTLFREDSLAQLKTAVDELGFHAKATNTLRSDDVMLPGLKRIGA